MTHLNSLFKTFHDICQPCSDTFPSELEKNLQLRRNQKFLIMQSTSFILLSLYVTLFKGNPNFTDFWFMSMFVVNLIVFALLCRRHHTFFKWYYAAVITLSSPIALYLHKDGIFACWSVVYLAPMLLLYYSGCRWFYITQVGIQLLYMNCYFKDKMIEVLNERTSQDFVQDLMSCQMFAVFLSSIIIYNIGVTLIDNFKQDIVYTENQRKELEVQKTFVLSFSHEIRNLINTLTGNIQLSLLEKIPPKVKSSLEDAEVGASLLLQLINNILDTGNLDIGELDINHSNQTIHSTLEKTWRMCAYVLKAKNLKGKFRILKNLPRNIKLDHDRFMQIMINLIVNAVKFTDKGSVDVELEWVPSRTCVTEDCFLPSPFDDEGEGIFEKDQAFSILNDDFTIIGLEKKKWSSDRYNNCRTSGPGLLKVSVTDTGYGVSQDNLSKVFDRFSSQVFGDGAASNKLGTTIGLYVTKELCHRMGGDIKIFSKIDKGTSFIACIPAEQTLPEKHSQQVPPSLLSLGTFHDERKLRAMIVDDMNFNIVVLTNYLERMKVEVANTAINGSDAFTKYVESVKMGKRFDVVTMDVEMPVMDGKEAARMIREYERENHLSPCFMVMISGNVCESEISQCMKHNGGTLANHFLKKPAIFEDVFRLINEHFSISSQTTISSIY